MKNYKETGRPPYRSIDQRKEVIKVDKATWFHKEGTTATLMVPWTRNSDLAKKLREVVMSSQGPRGTSVKIVEKPGLAVMSMIRGKKKFRRLSCGRLKCPLVASGSGCLDNCYQEGIIYTGTCKLCTDDNKKSIYIGESSRTLYTRVGQHINDFKRAKNRSDLLKMKD